MFHLDYNQQCERLNNQCASICREIIDLKEYVSFEMVYTTLLQRYGVQSLEQLGLGNEFFHAIPVLHLLDQISRKLDIFVTSFLSTRNIITAKDLEMEALSFLQVFNFPTLFSLIKPHDDPNEIFLDGDNTNFVDPTPNTMSEYGIGYFIKHPKLRDLFLNNIDTKSSIPSYANILLHLQNYLITNESNNKYDISKFSTYVQQQYNANSLLDIGVIIKGDIIEEIMALKYVVNEKKRIIAEHVNNELKYIQNQNNIKSINMTTKNKKRKFVSANGNNINNANDNNINETYFECYLSSDNISETIQNFIEECSTDLIIPESIPGDTQTNKKSNNSNINNKISVSLSPYPPSYSKLKSYLMKQLKVKECLELTCAVCDNMITIKSSDLLLKYNNKKLMANNSSIELIPNQKLFLQLIDVTTEYMMLHLGSRDYQNRKLKSNTCHENISSKSNENNTTQTNHPINNPFESKLKMNSKSIQSDLNSDDIEIINSEQLQSLFPFQSFESNYNKSDIESVGKWGESIIFQYLTTNTPFHTQIQWLNKDVESKAPYDFIVTYPHIHGREKTQFIEVKTSRFDLNVFELSLWEWKFATSDPIPSYHIYRIFNGNDPKNIKIVIIKNILKLLSERKIKLCIAV
eukprot:gene12559-16843_t